LPGRLFVPKPEANVETEAEAPIRRTEQIMDIQGDYEVQPAIPFRSDGIGHATSSKNQRVVLAAQSGCRTAFSDLWDLYSRRVYRTLLGIMKNPHDAEDALQDAFLRAYLAIGDFEGRANFYTWLTRIAINSALGILRKRRCRPETSLDATLRLEDDSPRVDFRDSARNPEQIYAEHEERENLKQAIQRLPLGLRNAIQMQVSGDCSVKELACRLNISEAAAKSRLHRARIMLASLTAFYTC
jgi:RNA polymerase sigma-70 factor, ECF subfamily